MIPTVTYQLSGGADLLQVHVGHKLEITGKTPAKTEASVKLTEAEVRKEEPAGKTPTTTKVTERAAIAVRPPAVEDVRAVAPNCFGM